MSNNTAVLEARGQAGATARAVPQSMRQIVVVGGGAGGLELVTALGNKLGKRRKAAVILIDKKRTHLWKPLLHEIAAGSMDLGVHEIDYLAQAHWNGFRYRVDELNGIDRQRRLVHVAPSVDEEGQQVTQQRAFLYDTLVIAVGSLTNDFGTPGVQRHAISLETPAEAARFHRRLVNACIRAHAQTEPLRPEQLQVAIIGAGATGTELAAELHRTTRQLVAFGLDQIDAERDIKIHLIEAADRILPALPSRLSESAANLPGPIYCWYVRNAYLENAIKRASATVQCGTPVDLARIDVPVFLLASREDHIVPWKTAYASTGLVSGATRFVLAASGHVAGVINPASRNKRSYWTGGEHGRGPDHWLATATPVPGSWWQDWSKWLADHAVK